MVMTAEESAIDGNMATVRQMIGRHEVNGEGRRVCTSCTAEYRSGELVRLDLFLQIVCPDARGGVYIYGQDVLPGHRSLFRLRYRRGAGKLVLREISRGTGERIFHEETGWSVPDAGETLSRVFSGYLSIPVQDGKFVIPSFQGDESDHAFRIPLEGPLQSMEA